MKKHESSTRALCVLTLIASAGLFGGCASIVHGGSRTINVGSQPAGAKVTISKTDSGASVHTGVTPFTVSLDPKRGFFKGQSYTVRFELDGYKTDEVVLRSQLSGWYFGNIVFGGVIGLLIVDPATGSMWNISPDKLDRPLSAQQARMLKTGDGFLVALVSDATDAERARMTKIN